MSFIDEPILRALRVRKQRYRFAMGVVCIAAGGGMLLAGWWIGLIVAGVGMVKVANYLTSNDSPEARYGD